MKFYKTAAVMLSAALLIAASGCEAADSDNNNVVFYDSENPYVPDKPNSADMPLGNEITAQKGSAADAAMLSVTLDDVSIFDTVSPDFAHTVETDYIACKFTITNNSNDSYTAYSMSDFRILNGGERQVPNITAMLLMNTNKIDDYNPLDGAEIPSGESFTGHLIFEYPSDWNSFTLQFIPQQAENKNNDYLSFEITKDMIS